MVVGCNFCPFAARPLKQETIQYHVSYDTTPALVLQSFLKECLRLDHFASIETSFIILPNAYAGFEDYLDLVDLAEKLLKIEGYEGVYQVAGFHPLYSFAGAPESDAANFTNRSIYPMLHLLREARITEVLLQYPDPQNIPQRNIDFARSKGTAYMKMLRDTCL